jgi:hypothetical protein
MSNLDELEQKGTCSYHFLARCARILRGKLYCNRGRMVGQVKHQITDLLKFLEDATILTSVGSRLMVGQQTLDLSVGVRVPAPQYCCLIGQDYNLALLFYTMASPPPLTTSPLRCLKRKDIDENKNLSYSVWGQKQNRCMICIL